MPVGCPRAGRMVGMYHIHVGGNGWTDEDRERIMARAKETVKKRKAAGKAAPKSAPKPKGKPVAAPEPTPNPATDGACVGESEADVETVKAELITGGMSEEEAETVVASMRPDHPITPAEAAAAAVDPEPARTAGRVLPLNREARKASKAKVVKAKKGPKPPNACECGCGGDTKRRFVPGHDAKLHSMVLKVEKGKAKVGDFPEMHRAAIRRCLKAGEGAASA